MEETNRTVNSVRNSFWGLTAKLLAMICSFFFRMFIIREIGAAYIGLNGLFGSILKVLSISELGLGSAIVYMMYKPVAEGDLPEIGKLLNTIRKLHKYIGLFILVAGCCVYPFLDKLVKNNTGIDVNIYLLYSIYLFDTVVSYFAFAYRSSLFSAHQRSDILHKITLILEVIKYVTQALVLFFLKNYYLYVLVSAFIVILRNIILYIYSRRVYPDIQCKGTITTEQKKSIMSKIVPLVGHRIGGMVIVSIDDMILSAFLGISVLTQYDNYYFVFSSIVTLLTIMRNSMLASLGNKLYTSSGDELYFTFKKIHFFWMCVVGWCTCCLAGLFQPFIGMWAGKKYVYDDSIMLCICLYFFAWQFRALNLTMRDAAGLWEPDRFKPIIGMALNLILSIIFVKITGSVLGVLLPTIFIMFTIYFPWETTVLFKHLFHRSPKEYLMITAGLFATIILCFGATYFTTSRIADNGIFPFLLRIALCISIPAVIFFIIYHKSFLFRSLMEDGKAIIKRRHSKKK